MQDTPKRNEEMQDEKLRAAERTWDTFDLDLARRVAWTSYGPIAGTGALDLPAGWSLTSYIHSELRQRLQSQNPSQPTTGLAGCALVCGDMAAERHFFMLKEFVGFSTVDGFDLSSESLKKAQLNGVTFRPHHADCNQIELPAETYDLIVGHQGLHHVQELPRLFEQVQRSIKPTGLLFIGEWIGPRYLQIPLANRWLSIALLYLLFPSKRMRTNHMGQTKGIKFLQYGKEIFDPSEACNSEVLEPELLKRFRYLKKVHFGGLCYPMFEGNAIHLDENNPDIRKRVGWVIRIERLLTRWGIVKPLFVIGICEKRS